MTHKAKKDNQEPDIEVEIVPQVPHSREGKTPANAYPQETIEEALDLMLTHPITKVAEITGVSRRTLHEWKAKYGQWVQMAKDAEIVEEIDQTISEVLRRIDPDKLDKANARDLGIVLGILVDKKVALGGKPKDNSATRAKIAWRNPDGHELGIEIG